MLPPMVVDRSSAQRDVIFSGLTIFLNIIRCISGFYSKGPSKSVARINADQVHSEQSMEIMSKGKYIINVEIKIKAWKPAFYEGEGRHCFGRLVDFQKVTLQERILPAE